MCAIPLGPFQCKCDERPFDRIDIGAGIGDSDQEERSIGATNLDRCIVRTLTPTRGFHAASTGQARYQPSVRSNLAIHASCERIGDVAEIQGRSICASAHCDWLKTDSSCCQLGRANGEDPPYELLGASVSVQRRSCSINPPQTRRARNFTQTGRKFAVPDRPWRHKLSAPQPTWRRLIV